MFAISVVGAGSSSIWFGVWFFYIAFLADKKKRQWTTGWVQRFWEITSVRHSFEWSNSDPLLMMVWDMNKTRTNHGQPLSFTCQLGSTSLRHELNQVQFTIELNQVDQLFWDMNWMMFNLQLNWLIQSNFLDTYLFREKLLKNWNLMMCLDWRLSQSKYVSTCFKVNKLLIAIEFF